MPEPVTMCALGAAGTYLVGWFRGHVGKEKATVQDLEQERMKASGFLRDHGWHCTTCPYIKFLQIVPQVEESLMEILKDPVFQKSESLREWMEHQLRQALKLEAGSDDLKSETVHSVLLEGKFATMMAVIFVRPLPTQKVASPFAKDTSVKVWKRVKGLGRKYQAVADLMKEDGVDGDYLAHHDISREILAEEYEITRKINQDVLLHLFEQYKPRMIPYVAIGLAACSAEFDHRGENKSWFGMFGGGGGADAGALGHEDLKVRAQKMMAYQSSKAFLNGSMTWAPQMLADQSSQDQAGEKDQSETNQSCVGDRASDGSFERVEPEG